MAKKAKRPLAIHRLQTRITAALAAGGDPGATVERFFARRTLPIVEGDAVTFAARVSDADDVFLRHRVLGFPDVLPLERVVGTDLWWVVLQIPAYSRVEYQFEALRGERWDRFNDPANPRRADSPMGASSVCWSRGYATPAWALPDPTVAGGELLELTVPSESQRRTNRVTVYRPAVLPLTGRWPLLVVHDGGDYLAYASMAAVLDNLIASSEIAPLLVAFTYPGDRLEEYPDSPEHAAWIATELVPELERRFPLLGRPSSRCLMGASFGAVASLSTAVRHPGLFGSLLLQSGSFVFTDVGFHHGENTAFDPVVRFVNTFRKHPRRVVERAFVSCGIFEDLIVPNRGMLPTWDAAGIAVAYAESRDGHYWQSWRDRLQDGLTWLFPGDAALFSD